MPLSGHSVGTYPERSSHATCQGTFGYSRLSSLSNWTDPGLKSGISLRELVSTLKKKKKAQARNEWSNIFLKFSQARKKPPLSLTIAVIMLKNFSVSRFKANDRKNVVSYLFN